MRRCCSRFTRGKQPCWNGGCDFPTHLQALSRRAIFKCPGRARSGCSCCAQMIGFQRSPWRGPMLFCDPAEEPCSATNPSNQAELFFTAKTRSARRKAEESFAVRKGFLRATILFAFFSRTSRLRGEIFAWMSLRFGFISAISGGTIRPCGEARLRIPPGGPSLTRVGPFLLILPCRRSPRAAQEQILS